MTKPGGSLDSHPSSQAVSAYLDGMLSPGEAAALEAHLVECPACRLESVEVLAAIQGRRRRRRLLFVVPALAAAAAAVLVIWLPRPGQPSDQAVLRGDSSSSAIEVLTPASDIALDEPRPTFRWRAAAESVRYVLTLTDDRGNLLWSVETGDTIAVLPDSVALARERTYLWYVDARLPAARSASSGIHQFRTSP